MGGHGKNGRRRRRRRRRRGDMPIDSNITSALLQERQQRGKSSEVEYQERKQMLSEQADAEFNEANLFIGNIKYQATAKQLVAVLTAALGHSASSTTTPILACNIVTTRAGESRGFGFAVVASEQVASRLIHASKQHALVLLGRRLIVRQEHLRRKMRQDTSNEPVSTPLQRIQIGSHDSGVFVCQYTKDLPPSGSSCVSLNRPARLLSITLDDKDGDKHNASTHLLEIDVKKILAGSVRLLSDTLMELALLEPPRLFKRGASSFLRHGLDALASAFSDLFADLETDLRDRASWNEWTAGQSSKSSSPPSGTTAQSDPNFERCCDSLTNGALGRCIVYQLTLPRPSDITEQLHRFGLLKTAIPHPVSQQECLSTFSLADQIDDRSWTGNRASDEILNHRLPFSTRYGLHCLISANRLDLCRVSTARAVSDLLSDVSDNLAADVLSLMYFENGNMVYVNPINDISNWLQRLEDDDTEELLSDTEASSAMQDRNRGGPVMTNRVNVTPLRVCPLPPQLDDSNRILRDYEHMQHRFIRVTFTDESFASVQQVVRSDLISNGRIRRPLKQSSAVDSKSGLMIAGRTFHFLAYSSSQLRAHSCWVYDSEPDHLDAHPPSADEIRAKIGDLSMITSVGKYGARLGQALTSTTTTKQIPSHQIGRISDVMSPNGLCFSDGVGMMSCLLAEQLSDDVSPSDLSDGTEHLPYPSAFQIRLGGCKGVLSVWPQSYLPAGKQVAIRPSMTKFPSTHMRLEVCGIARRLPMYLNRQLITVLSALGVPDHTFEALQAQHIGRLSQLLDGREFALPIVQDTTGFGSQMSRMLLAGFCPTTEPCLRGLLLSLQRRLMLDVRTRARILVPDGACLMGVMDESASLQSGEVFVQIDGRVLTGPLLVGRNPSLHVGDVRVLTGVESADLKTCQHNTVVFPAVGPRPHPNEMSGGDLDGDLFFVSWDSQLVQIRQQAPAVYAASVGALVGKSGDEILADDVVDFFVDYIRSDQLGVIANAWLVTADVYGAADSRCLRLAELHSTAVDFCKTGVPAVLPKELKMHTYPDFMEKKYHESYESPRVLGKLFRSAKSISLKDGESRRRYRATTAAAAAAEPPRVDPDLLVDGFEMYLQEARHVRDEYNWEMQAIMYRFGVHDEAELHSGFVRKFSRRLAKRGGHASADVQSLLNKELKRLRESYAEEFGGVDAPSGGVQDRQDAEVQPGLEQLRKASAWYYCCYKEPAFENTYWHSFAWTISPLLCQIKRHRRLLVEGNM